MHSKKIWPWAAFVFGVITGLVGMALIGIYILEAVVARVGEPDQSLLFWYLPILFLGLIGLSIGLGTGIWGFHRLKK